MPPARPPKGRARRPVAVRIAEVDIDLRVFPHLRHEHDVDTVVREAQTAHALIVSTLVRAEERELLFLRCSEHTVPCVDLLGSLLGSLAGFFGVQPRGIPGLLHTVSTGYFRRMEAIEFTVHSDDGREPDALLRADLVLVGSAASKTRCRFISRRRASKSPTCRWFSTCRRLLSWPGRARASSLLSPSSPKPCSPSVASACCACTWIWCPT